MKTIITFLLPLIAVVSSIASYNFFGYSTYAISAVLTVVAYLSASMFVYLLIEHKKVAVH